MYEGITAFAKSAGSALEMERAMNCPKHFCCKPHSSPWAPALSLRLYKLNQRTDSVIRI